MDNVTEAFFNMRNQQRANIMRAFGVSEMEKSEDLDIEKADCLKMEKSDILNAISYGGAYTNFSIKKNGKEIKEQIKDNILPIKQAELVTEKAKAEKYLSECGDAPLKDVCPWWTNDIKMEVGYKVYSWEECSMCCKDGISDSLSLEHQESKETCNYPQTNDEAKARRNYNDTIQCICRIMVDIKACDILINNLKDDEEIALTPQQLLAFKFD